MTNFFTRRSRRGAKDVNRRQANRGEPRMTGIAFSLFSDFRFVAGFEIRTSDCESTRFPRLPPVKDLGVPSRPSCKRQGLFRVSSFGFRMYAAVLLAFGSAVDRKSV